MDHVSPPAAEPTRAEARTRRVANRLPTDRRRLQERTNVERVNGRFPDPHRDPFDRVFAAQSLAHELPVVAVDPVFDGFGVIRVWGKEASFGSRRPGRFRVHGKGLSACVSVNR